MINLPSTLAVDIVGFLMMAILLLTQGWRIQTRLSESRVLFIMVISVMCGCIANSTAALIDGMPGYGVHILNYFLNFILFSLNIIISPCYIVFLVVHINDKLSRFQKVILLVICITESVLLLVNFFVPLVFGIDEQNVYQRGPLFYVYALFEFVLLMYGLYVYIKGRLSGLVLQFFPAWIFVVPIAWGIIFQSSEYGISVIWPCVGVALCGIALCMQKESIYLDKLTGVYNRFYLEELKDNVGKRITGRFGAMMLDLNDFKHINDQYSHSEGDAALVAFAGILQDVVGNKGAVIRFAGDEFVVLLSSDSEDDLKENKRLILEKIDKYNESSNKPYKLSASIGADIYDFKGNNISSFMNEIDKLMYEDKTRYYQTHNRRRNDVNMTAEK